MYWYSDFGFIITKTWSNLRVLEIISNLVYQFLKFWKSRTNISFGYARTTFTLEIYL